MLEIALGVGILINVVAMLFGDVIMYRYQDWKRERAKRDELRRRSELIRRMQKLVERKSSQ